MGISLDLLVKNQGNMYILTCAVIKRAIQLNITGDEEIDANKGKVVITALNQILSQKVQYQLES